MTFLRDLEPTSTGPTFVGSTREFETLAELLVPLLRELFDEPPNLKGIPT